MQSSKEDSVQQRLRAFSAVALAFLAVLGVVAFWSIHRLAKSSEAMLATQAVLRSHLEADMAHDAVHAAAFAAVLAGEERARSPKSAAGSAEREQAIRRDLAEEVTTLRGGLVAVESAKLGDQASRLAATARPHLATYVARAEGVVDLAFRDLAAARGALPRFEESFEQVKSDLANLSDAVEAVAEDDQRSSERLAWIVRLLIPLSFLAAAVVFFRLASRLTQGIVVPLGRAVEIARAVAKGDLTVAIRNSESDEFGQLQQALKEMVDSLSQIVLRVREGAAEIDGTAREAAIGNDSLAARTATQAATVQETAASVEELSASVRQNASLANEAHSLAVATSEVAVDGGQAVNLVIETMAAIERRSAKVVEIVTLIDEIAFQTNILALNAAIEAAQAGEHGRGFAVVAAEVRRLAGRAAVAARQVREEIEGSAEQVAGGMQLVTTAGATIAETVLSTGKVARLMAQIAATTREQSGSLDQIDRAVARLDDVAQQNGALVEEATAAAGAIADQAHRLVRTVATFRVA